MTNQILFWRHTHFWELLPSLVWQGKLPAGGWKAFPVCTSIFNIFGFWGFNCRNLQGKQAWSTTIIWKKINCKFRVILAIKVIAYASLLPWFEEPSDTPSSSWSSLTKIEGAQTEVQVVFTNQLSVALMYACHIYGHYITLDTTVSWSFSAKSYKNCFHSPWVSFKLLSNKISVWNSDSDTQCNNDNLLIQYKFGTPLCIFKSLNCPQKWLKWLLLAS